MIEVIAILDRSGSMVGKEQDVIGGYNKFIDEQKKIPGKAKVTTVLFDDRYEVIHKRVPLNDIEPITDKQYFVRGSTALLDAVGKTLSAAKKKNKGIVFVFTDGLENFSKEYKKADVKRLVEERKAAGWEVHFLGAGIDAYNEAASMGIDRDQTLNTTADAIGIRQSSDYLSSNTALYRSKNNTTC